MNIYLKDSLYIIVNMNKLYKLLFLFTVFEQIDAMSCRFGRGACIASCMAQNCATGYCIGPDPNTAICTCSRCGIGPPL